ncbi:MAG: integrase arm-type DNA-binding domain-containing protein [Desulfobia sp.]
MPKRAKELSAVEVKRITQPGRHSVGVPPGLLLVVKKSGAKSWIYRTMVGIKRRSIGLGSYPTISLSQAREKARGIKHKIEEGADPTKERQAKREALIRSQQTAITFDEAARLCHKKKISEFKSKKHANDWINSINHHATPVIGEMPVSEIDLPHILQVLEPIWHQKTETATRVRQRLEQVLSWATVGGHRKGDNPARWKGHLDAVLPQPSKIRKTKHLQALPWQEIGLFMKNLRDRQGISARCLEFIILTVCRSGEARLATWDEIDMQNHVWTIPAERMKIEKEHSIPLSDDVVNILETLPRFEGSNYIFPAARGGPLSDTAVLMVCRRMKVDAVPHGFRSTFRDWCAENTNFPREVAEMALAHTIESKVEAAYRRGDLFQKRRKLMEAWADYCNKVQTEVPATVTPIRGAK